MGVLVDNATEQLISGKVTGYCLHSCFYVPFGEMNKPNEWLDPRLHGDLKLKLTGGSDAGKIKVLTQQLRI